MMQQALTVDQDVLNTSNQSFMDVVVITHTFVSQPKPIDPKEITNLINSHLNKLPDGEWYEDDILKWFENLVKTSKLNHNSFGLNKEMMNQIKTNNIYLKKVIQNFFNEMRRVDSDLYEYYLRLRDINSSMEDLKALREIRNAYRLSREIADKSLKELEPNKLDQSRYKILKDRWVKILLLHIRIHSIILHIEKKEFARASSEIDLLGHERVRIALETSLL